MDILLVEDDAAVSSVLTEIIRCWGYCIEHVDTCKKVLENARQRRFDLVLLDIFLPDGKGHKLIPQLKELWPEVGIVTMTGYNTREIEKEVREQGILYYMIKPFDTGYLKELLDHLSQKYDQKKKSDIRPQLRVEPTMNKGQLVKMNVTEAGGDRDIV